ncbi:MAG TPA: hypothetical protein VMZ28_21275 [Kofleriaceae bacterium]|nr:hypothetical protein [Kofleriaceae bacterium]
MHSTRSWFLVSVAAVLLAACGGGGDDDSDGSGADGGGEGECGFDGDSYLPYEVGYTWTYRLTDLGSGERATKEQRIDEEMEHPDFGSVVVQVTGKLSGETVSLARRDGDRVIRFQQEDYDSTGALERTTTYDPGQIRIDETAAHLEVDAEWDESYTETTVDDLGVETVVETTDHWTVLGVDEECESPLGTFSCIRLRKTRTEGGVAEKEFHFARGIGKIREVGANQLEELTACGPE